MPSAHAIVLYPRKEGSTFNADYYLSTHMPLVEKLWKPLGLKTYTVTELRSNFDYSYSCTLEFESTEALEKASDDASAKEIMGDIPNFSSEQPLLVGGKVIHQG